MNAITDEELASARELWDGLQDSHKTAMKDWSAGRRRASLNKWRRKADIVLAWMVQGGGLGQLLATIDAQAAEITRLRSMLPTTADGVSIADCSELYCPHCGDKVLQYDRCCVCENCGTDESGTMELEYSETVSKPKETERA